MMENFYLFSSLSLRQLLANYVESLDSGQDLERANSMLQRKFTMKSYTDSFMSKLSHKLLGFIK